MKTLYEGIQDNSIQPSDVTESKELLKLERCIHKYRTILAEKSRTAKLWLECIDYVDIVKLFIRAERMTCIL